MDVESTVDTLLMAVRILPKDEMTAGVIPVKNVEESVSKETPAL